MPQLSCLLERQSKKSFVTRACWLGRRIQPLTGRIPSWLLLCTPQNIKLAALQPLLHILQKVVIYTLGPRTAAYEPDLEVMSASTMPITQIIHLRNERRVEGHIFDDPKWQAALDHCEQAPGFQRLYWGQSHECPEHVELHIGEAFPIMYNNTTI